MTDLERKVPITPTPAIALADKALDYVKTGSGNPESILKAYRDSRNGVPVRLLAHPSPILDLLLETLPRNLTFSRSQISELIGGKTIENGAAIKYLSARGLKILASRSKIVVKDDSGHCPLLPWIEEQLGTTLEQVYFSRESVHAANPNAHACWRAWAIDDPAIRILAGLSIVARAKEGGSAISQLEGARTYAHVANEIALYNVAFVERQEAIFKAASSPDFVLLKSKQRRNRWSAGLTAIRRQIDEVAIESDAYSDAKTLTKIIDSCIQKALRPTSLSGRNSSSNSTDDSKQLEAHLGGMNGEPEDLLAEYRAQRFRRSLDGIPHPEYALDLASLYFRDKKLTKRSLHAVLGGVGRNIPKAFVAVCKRLGYVPPVPNDAPYRVKEPLRPWISTILGTLPETYLDKDFGVEIKGPRLSWSTRIFAFKIPQVRLAAALATVIAVAQGTLEATVLDVIRSFELFDEKLCEVLNFSNIEDIDLFALDYETMRAAIDKILSDDTRSAYFRDKIFSQLKHGLHRIEAYMVRFPAIAALYCPWQLNLPWMPVRTSLKRLRKQTETERFQQREESCSAIADNVRAIYRGYDIRFAQIGKIRDAFDAQCLAINKGELLLFNGRSDFCITLERYSSDGTLVPGFCTLDFSVVTLDYLLSIVPRATRKALGESERDALMLMYHGPRHECDRLVVDENGIPDPGQVEPPVLAMYRYGCFMNSLPPAEELRVQRERLLPSAVWQSRAYGPRLFRAKSRLLNRFVARCLAHGVVLIPIREAHHAMAVGRALGRSILRGARIGEALQQTLSPTSFQPVEGTDPPLWRYRAIAKARTLPEDFIINKNDLEAIMDVPRIAKRNGWTTNVIKACADLQRKVSPAPFIYQRDGSRLDGDVLYPVSIPLWPLSIRTHDLRHGIARHYRALNMPVGAISAFLHHSQPGNEYAKSIITSSAPVHGYIRPTKKMRSDLVQFLTLYNETDHDLPQH